MRFKLRKSRKIPAFMQADQDKFTKRPSRPRGARSNKYIIGNFVLALSLLIFIVWSQADLWFSAHPGRQAVTPQEEATLNILSSSEIARSLAILGNYREVTWIDIQAYNSRARRSLSLGSIPVVNKPAVINSTIRTKKDILHYVVSPGDTILRLATDFNVSSESIRLSNNLTGNSLEVGKTIYIPPRDLSGVVYQIDASDTLDTLAQRFSFSVNDLVSFNDLSLEEDLPTGEFIFIPDASVITSSNVPSFLFGAANFPNNPNQMLLENQTAANCPGCKFVHAGEVIGKLGNTGWSTGPHLHVEIHTLNNHRHNPWAFINQNRLVWPVNQSYRRVTQIYHSGHSGLDIGHEEGADVLAIADGQIIYRGCLWQNTRYWSTFGVIIDHGSYYSFSIHLQAPDNPVYELCSINRRTQFGARSIDYTTNL